MTNADMLSRLQDYFNTGRYDRALRFLEEQKNASPELNSDGALDYHLGRILYFQNLFEKARERFLAALKKNPRHLQAKFFLARAMESAGEVGETLRLYANCVADRPDLVQINDYTNEAILRNPFTSDELRFLNMPKEGNGQRSLPLISIIILCYNKMEFSELCLNSVFKNTDYPNYEVIVVDNASVDETPFLIETFARKVTFIRSERNLGFVGGNNMAAKQAHGDYLVFLNNDTVVTPGWLTELHRLFQLHSDTGAAGSKLIYPDGRLQEAGGIIFRDGTGWNYGRYKDPNASGYQFVREVDYCSGAALMVRTDLFFKLGSFDERFAPAYYEDTDLCFGVRKLGYAVRYCPHSVVIHQEGATAGTDVNVGFKKYQNLNAPKFRKKWAKELSLQYPLDENLRYLFSNRGKGKKILIIDDLPPLPDRAAGSLRMYHTVQQFLNLGCQVVYAHLMGMNLDAAARNHMKALQARGVEFVWFNYESWWAFRDSNEAKPYQRQLIQGLDLPLRKFDLVYICFWHIGRYFIDLIRERDQNVPILVDSMDLHYLRELRQAEVKNDASLKKHALETKKAELETYAKSDAVTTVTLQDREVLRKDLPGTPVFIMTDVHDPVERTPAFDQRSGLVFVGNFNHRPNEDAAVYFVREVFPLVRRELPNVKFFIVGNNPTPMVRALASETVIVTGWVPEVRPYLDRCRVEVVPLRYGAGNKGKVGEAFAHGIPMVMTSIGAEGMKVAHGEHAFIADSPDEFARQTVLLYTDRNLWDKFSVSGKNHVASMYSSELKRRRIEYLLSFVDRKAFRSYRALEYPLPPETSIILPLTENRKGVEQTLRKIKSAITRSHEIIGVVNGLSDKDRMRLAALTPEARIPDRYHAGMLESYNDALSSALGEKIFVLAESPGQDAESWLDELKRMNAGEAAVPAADIACGWITIPRSLLETIGGLDERFKSLRAAAVDFQRRANLAGVSYLTEDSVTTPPLAMALCGEEDAALLRERWDTPLFETQNVLAPQSRREIRYPIDRNPFIAAYEQADYFRKEVKPHLALSSLFKAVSFFHASARKGRFIEFPQIMEKIDTLLDSFDAAGQVLQRLAGLMQQNPADTAVALGAAEYLIERNRPEEAAQAMRTWLSDSAIKGVSSETVEKKIRALSAGLTVGRELSGFVSIVILTFNQLKYTKECVESIRKHTPEKHEIIFVDNGSTDGTVKWLKQLVKDKGNYRLIENAKNLGFSKGCNQGIEAAAGEYILLLNNDVVVTKDWLSGMLECLSSASDIGIVGPMTNNISGPQKIEHIGYSSVDQLDEYAANFGAKNRHRRIPMRRIVGFCMLFRRTLLDSAGLFDERFGSGNFEDDDFCLRSTLAGFRNTAAGDVFIHHYGSRSFIGNRIDYNSSLSGNRKIFSRKWGSVDAQSPLGSRLLVVNALDKARECHHRAQEDDAAKALIEAIKRAPGVRDIYLSLAEILIDNKQFKDCVDVLNMMPQDEGDLQRLVLMGYCKEGLELYDEAADYAERALVLNAAFAPALNLKGVLAYKKGDRSSAEDFFKKAAESDLGYGEPLTNLGVLKWAAGQREEALNLLERGFILSPTIADIITSYHTAIAASGALARAEEVFREALALYPMNRRIAFLLIDVLIHQDKQEIAMQNIEQAMMLFGIEEDMLAAALEVRKKIGPQHIDKASRTKPTLSLCMIVKNEEQHLPRCLMSVKPIVDEMIVVDTGSTDRTRDIAIAFGATVYDYPWTGDFSEARNFSLSKASGNWILVLDADEVISPMDHPSLTKLYSQRGSRPAAHAFVTRNYIVPVYKTGWTANDGKYGREEAGTGWFGSVKVRLFLRDSRIRFVNQVHELVEPSLKKAGIPVTDSSIPIHHYGKLNQEKSLSKGEEYYQLGKKKLEERGDDADAIRELAIQAGELKKLEEAVALWQRAIKLRPDMDAAYYNLVSVYIQMDRFSEALAASKRAAELRPDLKEAVCNHALCEIYAGDAKQAVAALENLVKKEPGYPSAGIMLAIAYMFTDNAAKGMALLQAMHITSSGLAEALYPFAKKLVAAGRIPYAVSLVDLAIKNGAHNDNIAALRAECGKLSTRAVSSATL